MKIRSFMAVYRRNTVVYELLFSPYCSVYGNGNIRLFTEFVMVDLGGSGINFIISDTDDDEPVAISLFPR